MKSSELLSHLKRRGILLTSEGGRLRYNAPKGALTPELREQLARNKQEMLMLLRQNAAGKDNSAASLQRISSDQKLPLSAVQKRMWFLEQMEAGAPSGNIPRGIRLRGPLNISALKQSVNEIVRRHEILRTTCATVKGEPVLAVSPHRPFTISITDLRERPDSERDAEVIRLAAEEAKKHFNIESDRMLRVSLLRLDHHEYVLFITAHHFAVDGWSMGIIYRDLSVLYDAFLNKTPSPLSDFSFQCADYIQWQSDHTPAHVKDAQLAYWQKQLAGAPSLFSLPADRPRSSVLRYRCDGETFALPENLSERLRTLCREEGVTLFMTLLAALKALLHRYNYQNDSVIGTAVSSRRLAEAENLIGPFANNLVLRADLSGNPTFRELLARVRNICVGAYANQEFPYEDLLEHLQLSRALSQNPLFQIYFNLHQFDVIYDLKLTGMEITRLPFEFDVMGFDLNLTIFDRESRLLGRLQYNTDLYDAATITRLISRYEMFLHGAAENPDRRIWEIPIISGTERHALLHEWNKAVRLKDGTYSASIASPVSHAGIYILDGYLNPAPVGVFGEIYAVDDGFAKDYSGQPDPAGRQFIPNPFVSESGGRLFKTGDWARFLPDGTIEFSGGADHQAEIKGFRVEFEEIESVLGGHEHVQKAVVVSRKDNSGNNRLVVYFIPRPHSRPSIDELRRFLSQKLPDYMIPAAFISLDSFPLLPNGKIDRFSLPLPDLSSLGKEKEFVGPRDDVETGLVKIWEEVLSVHPVGINDDFFSIGGHSLLAVGLFAKIEEVFKKRVELSAIFKAPTIRQLAELLRGDDMPAPWSPVVAIRPHGTKPPLFCLHTHTGLVLYYKALADCLDDDQPVYGLQSYYYKEGFEDTFITIEEMASRYIDDIRAVQPEGPYFLAGLCVGGYIAFEMARQLQMRGETVGMVAIIDAVASKLPYYYEVFAKRMLWFHRLKWRFRKAVKWICFATLAERRSTFLFYREKLSGYVRRVKRQMGMGAEPGDRPEIQERIIRKHQIARNRYHPLEYGGRVLFFRTVDRGLFVEFDRQTYGWSALAKGGVDVYDVPGDHEDVFSGPNTGVVAGVLKAHMDDVLSGRRWDRQGMHGIVEQKPGKKG